VSRTLHDERITLAHGAGGSATHALVEQVFVAAADNPLLAPLDDAAVLAAGQSRIAFTTDAYVVKPLEFPGGDIGELAVNGTVNDLAVCGAQPLALAAGFVLEEGLDLATLRRIAASLAGAAERAGVPLVAGDTKVVEHGRAEGLYVTTSGIGLVDERASLSPQAVRAGDRVLCSGSLADHGIAVMLARGELALEVDVASDTAPLWPLVDRLLALGEGVRWLRDPTRGGAATTLNELAESAGVGVLLREEAIPVRAPVAAACEILGIDPLYVANEGKLIAVVSADDADTALAALGPEAREIGEIVEGQAAPVVLATALGGRRVVDVLVGDPLPRIC
jgi:hydrogenase expression/formation protein HypE